MRAEFSTLVILLVCRRGLGDDPLCDSHKHALRQNLLFIRLQSAGCGQSGWGRPDGRRS